MLHIAHRPIGPNIPDSGERKLKNTSDAMGRVQTLPALLRKSRRYGREQSEEGGCGMDEEGGVCRCDGGGEEGVGQLDEVGDEGVEGECVAEGRGGGRDSRLGGLPKRHLGFCERGEGWEVGSVKHRFVLRVLAGVEGGELLSDEGVKFAEPALDAHDALLLPLEDLAHGRLEQHMCSDDIGAVSSDASGGIDAVVFALAHFLPADGRCLPRRKHLRRFRVAEVDFLGFEETAAVGIGVGFPVDHALGDESFKGLCVIGFATTGRPEGDAGEEFGHKARVEEVEDCVLDAADVDVDGEGGVGFGGGEGLGNIMGIYISHKVPGGVNKGVHGVCVATSGAGTAGAGGVDPVLGEFEGVAGFLVEVAAGEGGEFDREVGDWDGDGAALVAVDDGDWGAPVSLAADQPISEFPA